MLKSAVPFALPFAALCLVACAAMPGDPPPARSVGALERIDGWEGSGEALDVYFVPGGPELEDRIGASLEVLDRRHDDVSHDGARGMFRDMLAWGGAYLLGVAVIVGLLFHRLVMSPLKEATDVIETIRGGDLSRRIATDGSAEIARLAVSFQWSLVMAYVVILFVAALITMMIWFDIEGTGTFRLLAVAAILDAGITIVIPVFHRLSRSHAIATPSHPKHTSSLDEEIERLERRLAELKALRQRSRE